MISSAFQDWIGFDRKHVETVSCTLPSLIMHQAYHDRIMTHCLKVLWRKQWR